MGGWGHSGVFGVIRGQNSNIFKPRQFIYQNEALGHVITKKCSRGHVTPNWGGIRGHLGSKSEDFQTYKSYIPKWSSWSRGWEKVVFKVVRGYSTSNWGYLRSFGVKNWRFSNLDKWYTKMKLLLPLLRKVVFEVIREHLTLEWGYLRSFSVKIQRFSNLDK